MTFLNDHQPVAGRQYFQRCVVCLAKRPCAMHICNPESIGELFAQHILHLANVMLDYAANIRAEVQFFQNKNRMKHIPTVLQALTCFRALVYVIL